MRHRCPNCFECVPFRRIFTPARQWHCGHCYALLEIRENSKGNILVCIGFVVLGPLALASCALMPGGVKIIGATSHYVTDELDQGPIIAQSTLPVGHRDTVDDLIRKGRDLERVVLASAVRLHTEDKTLVSQNKTVVFD